MKFLLINFFFSFLLAINFPTALLAKNLEAFYKVEIGAINIGSLKWVIDIEDDSYKTSMFLKNKGLISGLYNFRGEYLSEGKIVKGEFIPSLYKQLWKTRKKTRKVEILFDNRMVSNLFLSPKEKEFSRVDYLKIEGLVDPLSSFLNILVNDKNNFKTIDGRRLYNLSIDLEKKDKNIVSKKIFVKNYLNIWADHKRKDLKFIIIEQDLSDKEKLFPNNIKIKNKGLIFKLTKI